MVAARLKSASRQCRVVAAPRKKCYCGCLSEVLNDVELSCASRAAFLPVLLLGSFYVVVSVPLMNWLVYEL